jgi:hypothetical protein
VCGYPLTRAQGSHAAQSPCHASRWQRVAPGTPAVGVDQAVLFTIDRSMRFGAAIMHALTQFSRPIHSSWRAPQRALHQVADAARNNNLLAVWAMLRCGFPVTAQSQHGATPLHWAALHGNPDMVEEVLRHAPPIDAQDRQFHGTAMGGSSTARSTHGVFDWATRRVRSPASWRGRSRGRGVTANRTRCGRSGAARAFRESLSVSALT